MNSNFQKLYNLLLKDKPEKSDAVIWLQGDRYDRAKKVLEIYRSKLAKLVVISGNNILIGPSTRVRENNIGLSDMKNYLIENGVSQNDIIINDGVTNTKEQAIQIIKLAKQINWRKIILVTSAYHQPRTFLSFVKATHLFSYNGKIINQGVKISDDKIISGRPVGIGFLMKEELNKIKVYQLKGDIASYVDGFDYLEKNSNTSKKIKFRLATINDANLLLKWRNDLKTRKSSHSVSMIRMKDHIKWLTFSLKNYKRKIFIAECVGVPVGTVRTDFSEGVSELSWTIAPEARGHGFGKEMMITFANHFYGPIQAEIKIDNKFSKHIAEYIGMKFSYEENGILHYIRPAISIPKDKL